MKKYKVPLIVSEHYFMEVEANSYEDAVDKAESLAESVHPDSHYEIDIEGIEELSE